MGRYFLDNGGSHILMCYNLSGSNLCCRSQSQHYTPRLHRIRIEYHKELDDVKILEALVYVYEFIQYSTKLFENANN